MAYSKGPHHQSRNIMFAIFLALSIFHIALANEDEYISDAQSSCHQTRDTFSCFKFRALRYISGIAKGDIWPADNVTSRADGSRLFNLVHIKNSEESTEETGRYFDESKQMKNDSEFDKFIKFTKRQIELYMSNHGITFGLPEGATTIPLEDASVNEIARSAGSSKAARGKKKKFAMLLPLLSLFSLFKVKLLLVPMLLTVLFIKKILVLAILFLPSILSTLKVCKMQNPSGGHGHSQWASAEATQDYSSGYANAGYPSYAGAASAGYNKDWGASRAYGGYNNQNAAYKTIGDTSSYTSPTNFAVSTNKQ